MLPESVYFCIFFNILRVQAENNVQKFTLYSNLFTSALLHSCFMIIQSFIGDHINDDNLFMTLSNLYFCLQTEFCFTIVLE